MKLKIMVGILPLFLALDGNQLMAVDDLPAKLTGMIVDVPKVPIAKAHVWVHNERGGAHYEAESDLSGGFSIKLPDGYFDVMVGAPGFEPVSKGIWIDSGVSIRWQVILCADGERLTDGPPRPAIPKPCSRIQRVN